MVEMGDLVQRLSHCAVTQAVYGAIHKTDNSTGRHNAYLEVRQMVVRLYETPPSRRMFDSVAADLQSDAN